MTGPTTCANYSTTPCTPNLNGTRFTYDSVGRQKVGGGGVKTYDAEDHILSEEHNMPGRPHMRKAFQLRYIWGPIAHPFGIGSTSIVENASPTTPTDFVDETLYWDHDDLLFTQGATSSGYGVDDIKIGNLGDYINKPGGPVGVTVWDRDAKGDALGCHTASVTQLVSWYSFLTSPLRCAPAGNVMPVPPGSNGGGTLVGHGAVVTTPRSDGVFDGFNAIQGVRAFDTQAGVWTTPDAYRGDPHDPMSQKPYMWNRNNPYEYSDPSGYEPQGRASDQAIAFAGKSKSNHSNKPPKKPITKKTTKKSGKEKASERPSWLIPEYGYPEPHETGETYAKRVLKDKYGDDWRKTRSDQFSQIKKWYWRSYYPTTLKKGQK